MVRHLYLQSSLQHLPGQPGQEPVRARRLDALAARRGHELFSDAGEIVLRRQHLTRLPVDPDMFLNFLVHT